MSENFSFISDTSKKAFKDLIRLANDNQGTDGLAGELSKIISQYFERINLDGFLNNLDQKLDTLKKYKGLEPEMAWDGVFNDFKDTEILLRLERFAIFICIYMRELSFNQNFEIDQGNTFYFLFEFVKKNKHRFSEESIWYLDFYEELPLLIIKNIYHSPHMRAVFNIVNTTDINQVNAYIRDKKLSTDKIDEWNLEFSAKEKSVIELGEKLDTYHAAFNFVGLNKGFSDLKDSKDKELKTQSILYYVIFAVLISIPLVELYFAANNLEILDINKLGFIIFPTITLLFILFWFLRIVLLQIKSIKSQLMQLELRMTLCKFIQNYAETSKQLKEHNKEGFEKFESLIFSSIVSSDDKIPATFDGMDQITSLIKTLNNR